MDNFSRAERSNIAALLFVEALAAGVLAQGGLLLPDREEE
jgi:hypothetical protein